ncbi:MAG: RNA-metabolising metallo-beta-lactamase [Bacteroidota bacterium]|jgi:metallo-beta-lactamase family protein|nr:RNA-metabolising metallo-beta-lactamase [Bacteroidota bacterium]
MTNKTISEVQIQFLGAAGTVTGSKYLIRTKTISILIDCGLFQGLKELRLLNWNTLPVEPSTIDVVLLTHGHLDHTGYLPKLIQKGFSGKIFGTKPTLEIAKIILEDSARIQEEDAERANAEGFSKHKPALPLYTEKDVKKTLPLFRPQPLDQWIELEKNIYCRFRYNGHIIGATFIELKIGSKTIVLSGDIGRENDLLMYPSQKPDNADVLLIESTYGDRLHKMESEKELSEIINNAFATQGTVIIPSFAVERTQTLMYLLWKLKKSRRIPELPIYMDSPMSNNVLEVFEDNLSWHKLPMDDCREMCRDIKLIRTIQETYALAKSDHPKIIIAGSGMASGGRVLTYLLQYIGKASATILLAGYQAEGTRGRALLNGVDKIKLFGKFYPVKAKIMNLEGLSSHADQKGLINWLSALKQAPDKIFIVHGESEGALGLQSKIKEVYGWDSVIPELNQVINL